jgi:hypothetical protein
MMAHGGRYSGGGSLVVSNKPQAMHQRFAPVSSYKSSMDAFDAQRLQSATRLSSSAAE